MWLWNCILVHKLLWFCWECKSLFLPSYYLTPGSSCTTTNYKCEVFPLYLFMKQVVVLISLACNYNSGFSSCHLSLEGFICYVYLTADTKKMFFEDLAFYGALYLLANKYSYSVSQKEVSYSVSFSCKQQWRDCIFFIMPIYHFLIVILVSLFYLLSSKGIFWWLVQSEHLLKSLHSHNNKVEITAVYKKK